jgi:hypothetical protein
MGEFARILRISKLSRVSLQLLQTMGIMIQNLRDTHSICKFSNSAVLSILYLQCGLQDLIRMLCLLQTIFLAMNISTS